MTNFYFFDIADTEAVEIVKVQATNFETALETLCDTYGTEYVSDNIIPIEKD